MYPNKSNKCGMTVILFSNAKRKVDKSNNTGKKNSLLLLWEAQVVHRFKSFYFT